MVPGNVYEVHITLMTTAYTFNQFHRVRLAISSSNYPRFAANPNNGLPINQQGPNVIAENTVYLSSSYPSHAIFPIVKESDMPKVNIK